MVDGMGYLSYRERLQKLGLTTLIERRMRGDLIETFKIMNGAVNYGQYMFHRNSAYNTRNINVASHHPTTASRDFFSNRVIEYWNQLPPPVKHASSVNAFKAGLDYFKFRKPNSMTSPKHQFLVPAGFPEFAARC